MDSLHNSKKTKNELLNENESLKKEIEMQNQFIKEIDRKYSQIIQNQSPKVF